MTEAEFLEMICQIVEADPGTTSASDALESLEGWDSMAVIVFQAEMDEKLGVQIAPADLVKCVTVSDLMALAGDKVTG